MIESDKSVRVSVILTSFNEGLHLNRILKDISRQTYEDGLFEILLLEAGDYAEEAVRNHLGEKASSLLYWNIPGLGRTASLNRLVHESKGKLVVRLDAWTHITPDYLE